MFDGIGFMELLLIAVISLVVLGPERLPTAVHTVSRWIKTIKGMARSVKDELEHELQIEKLHGDLKKAEQQGLESLDPALQRSVDELREAAEFVQRPYANEQNDALQNSDTDKTSISASSATPAPHTPTDNSNHK